MSLVEFRQHYGKMNQASKYSTELCILGTHVIIIPVDTKMHKGVLIDTTDEILQFVTTEEPAGHMLSEISQAQKNKYHMISLVWDLNK
jgi:hypothetical protein